MPALHRGLRSLFLWAALFLSVGVINAHAQETRQQRIAALDVVTRWKIANTLIFAIGLGYLMVKYAPPFFNARSAEIQKAIKDATGLKIEAEFRYSEIDRKMATLAGEVRKLREQSATELEREHRLVQQDTEAEIEHIRHNIQAEIEAFRNEGIQQIRRHTAELALKLAEQRLRDRFTSGEPEDLFQDFVHLVERGKN